MLKIKKVKIDKPIPFIKLIPNFLTILSLLIGISAVKFALDGKWESAVYCTLIAALIDGIDGRVARMLNATTPFGAELDCLCDFANFGVAPAYSIYLWSFQQYEYKVFSWAVILLFVACMALRLARFNATSWQEKKYQYFFAGVPAPCGAILALMPMIVDFEISAKLNIMARSHTILINIYITIIAFLLTSRLPTISAKNIRVKPEYLSLAMILFVTVIINIIIYPWYSLPVIALLYILSIPASIIIASRLVN